MHKLSGRPLLRILSKGRLARTATFWKVEFEKVEFYFEMSPCRLHGTATFLSDEMPVDTVGDFVNSRSSKPV